MYDVAALGELLVDFTYSGKSQNGMRLFEQNPGGAPANVLCVLSSLGLNCAFIGKVGSDMHGEFLRLVLDEKGVDTSGLIMSDDVFTTLAFVELSESGERKFSFARKPGADTSLLESELKPEIIENCKIFHFGSLSLTDEPSRAATLKAVRQAKQAGAIISYDPNYRAPLWKNEEEAANRILSVLNLVDIIKISDEETELITGLTSYQDAASFLLEKGIAAVVVTLGQNGAYAAINGASVLLPVPHVPVVDTTGAGDGFWGGFLYKLAKSGISVKELKESQLKEFMTFGNSVASLCVQKRGGIPSIPDMKQVNDFISHYY